MKPVRIMAIKTRYACACKRCGEAIEIGSEVMWAAGGFTWHPACAEAARDAGWNVELDYSPVPVEPEPTQDSQIGGHLQRAGTGARRERIHREASRSAIHALGASDHARRWPYL